MWTDKSSWSGETWGFCWIFVSVVFRETEVVVTGVSKLVEVSPSVVIIL